MSQLILEEYSQNRHYRFTITQVSLEEYHLQLQSYQGEYHDFTNVQGMSQVTSDQASAVKLGRAMLALLA